MKIFITTLMIMAAAFAVEAQERTAAGALDNQMTWTALSNAAKAAADKADAVNARVDQIVVCARKGMVYAPATGGADAQGCLLSATAPSVTNQLNSLQSTTQSMVSCNAQGYSFNGSGCIKPAASCRLVASSFSYTVRPIGGGSMNCPDGSVVVGQSSSNINSNDHQQVTGTCLNVVCN